MTTKPDAPDTAAATLADRPSEPQQGSMDPLNAAAPANQPTAAAHADQPSSTAPLATASPADAGPAKPGPAKPGPAVSSARPKKVRADQLLVQRDLVETRSRAQALILAGEVFSGEQRVEKSGQLLPEDAPLRVRKAQKYVSRGGLKLEGALLDLGVDPSGCVVADVGASTGGFTDCVLCRGATRVYAIDVGHGQLADKLRRDPRVVIMERINARHVTQEQVGGGVDLVVVDASFISLTKLLPAISAMLRPGGQLLALIKPQFEVGREEATRAAGVIRDKSVRRRAIDAVLAELPRFGFHAQADAPCRVPGPKGNVEHFSLSVRVETTAAPGPAGGPAGD